MHTDRVKVLVTGANGAVGQAVISELAKRPISIIATYRRQCPLDQKHCEWIHFDASASSGSDQLRAALSYPDNSLTAFIHCIGIPSSKKLISDTTDNEWTHLLTVNAVGLVRAYASVVQAARKGHAKVIVLSSDATRTISPRNGPYSASKAALESICQTLAKEEAAYGVSVKIIAPSLIDSPMAEHILQLKGIPNRDEYVASLPSGRMLSLNEVARAIVSMALDQHWDYVNGHIFRLSSIGQD